VSAARRLNPDRPIVVIIAVIFGALIVGSSFTLSFAGLSDVAAWGGAPQLLRPLVPIMIDAALLTYTLSWLVQRARGESTWLSWCSLALFTAVSLLGNSLHGWHPSLEVQRIVGTAVVGLAPVAVLLATHTLAQLLTEHVPRATDTAAKTPPITGSIPTISRVVDLDDARERLTKARPRRHARPRPPRAVRPARPARRQHTPDRQALAAKIRKLRDTDGLPFTDVGKAVGISRSRAHAIYHEVATS
jgi:hypothetical protein